MAGEEGMRGSGTFAFQFCGVQLGKVEIGNWEQQKSKY